jgi:EAL domain-containing protein (putative c-di-GMP-specific phosphodiesterase class I)
MAHCLDIEVAEEGVEDLATLQRLQELGCDFGQGYYWSPALDADEFMRFAVR